MTNKRTIFSKELIALLSAAFVIASAPAISANIPDIAESFPEVNPIYVGLLITIPSLFLILGVFLTGTIEKRIGRKNTIIIGLLSVGVFGTLPAWYQGSFMILFLSRALLGLGIGLFNRLVIQQISSLFQQKPEKKAKALGLESACEGLSGIIMTFSVGQLIKINWELSFIVYAFAFLGVGLVYFFLPQSKRVIDSKKVKENKQINISSESKIKSLFLGVILFLIVILFINYNLQITPVLIQKNIGTATQGSNMIAAIGAGAFIAGNLFGKTFSIFGRWLLPLATLSAGTFILGASVSNSALLTLICSMGLGFSFRNIMPYFMHILTSGGEENAKFGSTIVLVAYNLGATFSPYVNQLITKWNSNLLASTQLFVTAAFLWAIALFIFIFNRFINLTGGI